MSELGGSILSSVMTKTTEDDFQLFTDIEYRRIQGKKLLMDLYVPAGTASHPVILWIHGGMWQVGDNKRPPPVSLMTDHGFIIGSITYRFSQEALFPAQLLDCKAAVRWLRQHAEAYRINPEQIGAWGASSGGHLAALLGTTGDLDLFELSEEASIYSCRVQAVCDWYGPTDFLQMDRYAPPDSQLPHDAPDSPESLLIGGPIQEHKEKAQHANPITYISPDNPPFLIMHGDQDTFVPIHQSQLLTNALQQAGIEVTFHKLVGTGHGGRNFYTPEILEMVVHFFSEYLKQ